MITPDDIRVTFADLKPIKRVEIVADIPALQIHWLIQQPTMTEEHRTRWENKIRQHLWEKFIASQIPSTVDEILESPELTPP